MSVHARSIRRASIGLACLLAAGCGGGDDDPPVAKASPAAVRTQHAAEFVKQAEPLCSQVSSAMAEAELPGSFPADIKEFDTKSKAMLAAIEQPFGELAGLTAPEGQEAAFGRFSHALESAVREAKQLRTLVEQGNDDTDALWLPRTNVVTHASEAMNEANTLALESCTQLTFKEA